MNKASIKNLLSQDPSTEPTVSARGWVRSIRKSKTIAFVAINDGSCQQDLQLVCGQELLSSPALQAVSTGASIEAHGILKNSQGGKQKVEIAASSINVLGTVTPSYPLQKKGHSLEFLREISHLRGRTNTFGAVFRLRHALSFAVHKFFNEKGFLCAHTPILTAADCEGAGELFRVSSSNDSKTKSAEDSFFGKQAYLTVSGQLQAEMLALSHSKVYTFGPTFRAENSNTARHLAEFWMIEPEMAFCNLKQNCQLASEFLQYLIKYAVEHCNEELEFFQKFYKALSFKELEKLANSNIEEISYSDAILALQKAKKNFDYPVEWGCDLQTEHERYLAEELFKAPVIVRDYPKEIKAFYMRLNSDQKTVAAMDLLVPKVGEIIGGSQREERIEVLSARMDELAIPKEDLWWYLDLRRQGGVEHAGFGLGFERFIMFISGMKNIRDVVLCPRAAKSINF